MGKLIGVFKQGWLASLLGVAALASFIYFLGPLLAYKDIRPFDSVWNRYLLIGLLFISWLLWQVWKFWRARQKNKAMLSQLMASTKPALSPEEAASKEEVEILSERLQDALTSLEKSRLAKGGDTHLYQLPWYIIIGPPGAGKTTLLANSNLNFPLSDKYGKDAVRGVGGTRNCDWWFTDDAILLDTAGRYTTQDSQQAVDQSGWLGFLNLLKQYRGRQPINGVLIAVSIADLLQQSAELQTQHAKAIRKRIQELHEQLGIHFPVYMLFTKMDLLAGFTEFFDDLDKESRGQVWGMTFPYTEAKDQSYVGSFSAEFELLENHLNQQLIDKLDRERSTERRRALYLFPQQFSSLKASLQQFLEQIYQSTRYEETALLRGVYFTSATQEGAPIDRIMASLASSFGVKPQQVSRFSAQGKSFFINRLLNQVVFPEAGLAGMNLKLERRLQWVQHLALMGAVLVTILAVVLWFSSYFSNRSIQERYVSQVNTVQQDIASVPVNDRNKVFAALDKLRPLTWSYSDTRPEIPWFSRFGLSQVKTLSTTMDDKYESLLKEVLTPHAKQMLEEHIKVSLGKSDQAESLLNSLKNYLFLAGLNPKALNPAVNQQFDWNADGQLTNTDRSIALHIQNLLSVIKGSAIDEALVDQARKALREVKIDQLAYFSFKQESIKEASSHNFLIQDKKGLKDIDVSFQRVSRKPWTDTVSGFFTKAGYEKVFLPNYKKAAENFTADAWVLGGDVDRLQSADQIAKEFEAYYQDDYIAAWSNFLKDIQPTPINDLENAKVVLRGLTADGGNILFRLMEEVKEQTNFAPAEKEKSSFSLSLPSTVPPLIKVDSTFKLLHEWADATKFQRNSQLIDEVYRNLDKKNAFGQLENNALTNALDELLAESQKLPPLIGGILQQTVGAVRSKVVGAIQQELKSQFAGELKDTVGDFCQAELAKKYPFSATAKQGVDLANFTEFFQLNGRVDKFRNQQLQPNKVDAATLALVRKQLGISDQVRKAFFPQGHLGFSYSIKLVQLAPELQSLQLQTDTQQQTFKLSETKTFKWPDGQFIKVQGIPINNPIIPTPTPAVPPAPTGADPPVAEKVEPIEIASPQGDEWIVFRQFENKKWRLGKLAELQIITTNPANDPFQLATQAMRNFKCPAL